MTIALTRRRLGAAALTLSIPSLALPSSARAAGRVRMEEILMPVLPYFAAQCVLLLVMTLIPETILWPLKWIADYVPRVATPSLLNYF